MSCEVIQPADDCYCCSCGEGAFGQLTWDPACRNHGAHGMRGCTRHNAAAVVCDCGCES